MHMFFLDESGTPPKPSAKYPRYFVVGGIIIPENSWHRVKDALMGLKIRHKVRGELKWRYFAATNEDAKNPMRRMTVQKRDEIRADLYRIICAEKSVKTIACVCSTPAAYAMPSVTSQDDIYNLAYKGASERFQYYLQDVSKVVGRKEYGIVVADHRGAQDDKELRGHHQKLLHSTGEFISKYQNLIEGLFLEPSHLSVGIQLADLVAGAVWRKFERGDDRWYQHLESSLRRNADGVVDGYGIIKMPKKGWI